MIIYDNAGKNNNLEEDCAKTSKEIGFKFISPVTPQKNDMVEQVITTHFS